MAGADLNTPAPNTPVLDLLVEAGDWPAESELRELAQAALAAALAGLGGGADYPPLLRHPRASEARPEDPEQLGTPVKPERDEAGDTDAFPDSSPQGGGEQADAGSELSIVFTDNAAIQRLNAQYRGKDRPTNVLSFPQANGPLLGDIVLAWETVRDEAALAEKPLEAHMAHLVVHGFLHLLGYDHEAEAEAEEMEALERAALRRMGIADPYAAARE